LEEQRQKYQEIKDKLSAAGLKITQQRIVIYDA